VKHIEDSYAGDGGLKLYYQCWLPDGGPTRAIIAMLHGDFAQSGRYMSLPEHEAPRGYAVYAYDRRGWGRSPGQRGYIDRWNQNLADLDAFLQLVRSREPDCPIFLMGHTGSAVIVLEYAVQHPEKVRGVFCVSPVLNTGGAVPVPLRLLLYSLSAVAPRLTLDVRRRFDAQADTTSHDAEFVEATRADPLTNTKITPRWLTEAERAMQRVVTQAGALRVPLLFLIGGADRNSYPAASKAYFASLPFPDKELREYPGDYTNLLNESDYEHVLADIDQWLDRHV
jgi:alpha-beta hydrolase superfamily lysophospholipase